MRAANIIFRRELGAYLRSPMGWIVAAAVLLVAGILFQAFAMTGEQLSADVLRRFFWSTSGVVIGASIALSVRLLAEERQTHSITLLNTSPVRDSEIVLGKFLAALVFLAAILALTLYMPLLIKVNGKISAAQIAVGYLGLLLLGGASMAICMFASSLVKQQLLAAVIGLAMVVAMLVLYMLAKRVDPPLQGVLQDLDLWWLHFQQAFMNGVLTLKDTIYYLAIIYFFLLLATKTLEAKRWQ